MSQKVVAILVGQKGWRPEEARAAVEAARVCVDGVKPADLPAVLADLIDCQREEAIQDGRE